jgi:hypothetical protein
MRMGSLEDTTTAAFWVFGMLRDIMGELDSNDDDYVEHFIQGPASKLQAIKLARVISAKHEWSHDPL